MFVVSGLILEKTFLGLNDTRPLLIVLQQYSSHIYLNTYTVLCNAYLYNINYSHNVCVCVVCVQRENRSVVFMLYGRTPKNIQLCHMTFSNYIFHIHYGISQNPPFSDVEPFPHCKIIPPRIYFFMVNSFRTVGHYGHNHDELSIVESFYCFLQLNNTD